MVWIHQAFPSEWMYGESTVYYLKEFTEMFVFGRKAGNEPIASWIAICTQNLA
jgi:hypothetical protein